MLVLETAKKHMKSKNKKRKKEQPSLQDRLVEWRENKVSENKFILVLSFVVGVLTAIIAYILKLLIHNIQHFLTHSFHADKANWLYLVFPVVGILLTMYFIKYIVRDDIGHGVTKILYAISRNKARIKMHNTWSSVLASSITIGFGGSVGAESPIVLTGSAIGSNLGNFFRLNQRTLMLLVGCGASAAISGIFKAPIAGLVFTLEVLMIDLTMASLMPLLIAAVSASVVSYLFEGQKAMFEFHSADVFFNLHHIPYVILLGVLCGLASLYFTRAMNWSESIFRKFDNPYKKWMLGGLVLSVLIFLFPALYGEGYNSISILLDGTTQTDWNKVMEGSFFAGHSNLLLLYLLFIILFKVFASSATNGGGGCGGLFAPSLFLGAVVGFSYSNFVNNITSALGLHEKNFALAGMAGVMSAVMHAPLTGVFLIAELTGGYSLFVPLMITSVSAYLTILAFERHSIYSMRLAQKGELLTHNKDQSVLTLMKMENVVETNFKTVKPEMDLGQLVKVISESHRNIFPVIDDEGVLKGVVYLDDIRNLMFRQELYHRFDVQRLMTTIPATLLNTDRMDVVMKRFDDTKAWNLPVVDSVGKYLGFVSKSKIFNTYRQVLVHFSDE